MSVLIRCVADAIVEKGLRGLAEMFPGGALAYDVAATVLKNYREQRKEPEIRAEIQALAQTSFDDARKQARDAVEAAAPTAPLEDKIKLEMYLSQVPGTVRASLKRPADTSGKTVPSTFVLNGPEALIRLLPARPPRFKPNDPLPGQAGWSLVELLGAGGFGEVWLARHRSMSSLCGAVKFCHGQQANDLKHESDLIDRVMSAGKHKNIVPLTNVSFEGESPWLMYEYVQGGDLADVLRMWQKLDPEKRVQQTVNALRQISTAVAHFHRLTPAIVHRDLKPANILLDRANSQLRITDFGIGAVAAKAALSEELRSGSASAGRLITSMRGAHTPLYASPQQREGHDPDPRDDVHALGVIGYQLITGDLNQGPGSDFGDDLRDHGASEALIALLGRCVASKPDRRPKDAGELAEALSRLGTPGPVAEPPPPVPTSRAVPPPPFAPPPPPAEPAKQAPTPPKGFFAGWFAKSPPVTGSTPAAPDRSDPDEREEVPVEPDTEEEVGFWFGNVGESEWEDDEGNKISNRNWDDCRKYGFLAAGYSEKSAQAMKRLRPGAKVFAYMNKRGYVGYGVVTKAAVMARDFIPEGSTTPLLRLPLIGTELGHDRNDKENAEWVVGVRWHKTFDRDEAKTFSGAFAARLIVCRLREATTLRFLKKKFNVPDE